MKTIKELDDSNETMIGYKQALEDVLNVIEELKHKNLMGDMVLCHQLEELKLRING